ncbi:hypothetical protein ACKAV7_000264 [Fusarium commune]|uniref:Uncharacterized protein n=1 Tax=Fusarium oxysporum f. sp. rapae TaxID=485398 RepID=A0A8J5UE22_FUSOX|nr:hypothetical protein Forpe1208_v001723 [Fusarium oxysporum f. sp. rapae]
MNRNNPGLYRLPSDEQITREFDLWEEIEGSNKKNCRPWNKVFQHFTRSTSLKPSLESDVSLDHYPDSPASYFMESSTRDYVSHDPAYWEQASYVPVLYDESVDPELSNKNKWAGIQVHILLCMLSKRSKKQHIIAGKLRLAPKMGSHGTMEYMEREVRPLLTPGELSFAEILAHR